MGINGGNKLCAGLVVSLFPALAAAGPPVFQSGAAAAQLYDLASRRAQYEALQGIPTADIKYGQYGRLRSIDGRTGIVVQGAAQLKEGDSATALLETLKPMLMATELDALKVRKVVHAFGSRTIFMDQWIHGLPVIDGGVNVRVSETGEMILVSSLFVPPDVGAPREPRLTAAAAISRLHEQLLASGLQEIAIADAGQAHLAYWTNQGQEERPRLVWLLSASHLDQHGSREAVDYVVDGAIVNSGVRGLIRRQLC